MHFLITAGPTREFLDDVRFLSNPSSGRMGFAVAQAALQAGHAATLVSGPVELPDPAGVTVHRVVTTQQMYDRCAEVFPHCDAFVAAAAPCDFRPAQEFQGKLKKSGETRVLELAPTVDILGTLSRQRDRQVLVGFALEVEAPLANARRKIQAKGCDLLILNNPQTFGSHDSRAALLDQSGNIIEEFSGTKVELAGRIVQRVSELATLGDSPIRR